MQKLKGMSGNKSDRKNFGGAPSIQNAEHSKPPLYPIQNVQYTQEGLRKDK